ncbi:MAG: DUF4149 domain-containing protein [Acidobacteria bacterium]|nr:DUF4149 domain-containing protein [Acidobacteriota bacterium]
MHPSYLFSVWLHLLAATVWIGGMVFLSAVLVPVTRREECRGIAASLIQWTGRRFRWVGWLCFGVLFVTGVLNLAYRGFGWGDLWSGQLWQGDFGRVLAIKLLLVAVILLISALHDFVMGPRATASWRHNPASADAVRLRRQASWMGRVNLVLALSVAALAVTLVRGLPW